MPRSRSSKKTSVAKAGASGSAKTGGASSSAKTGNVPSPTTPTWKTSNTSTKKTPPPPPSPSATGQPPRVRSGTVPPGDGDTPPPSTTETEQAGTKQQEAEEDTGAHSTGTERFLLDGTDFGPYGQLWLDTMAETDPVFANKAILDAYTDGHGEDSLQPPAHTEDHLFPPAASRWQLPRFVPGPDARACLISGSRGPSCYPMTEANRKSACHNRGCAPAFAYKYVAESEHETDFSVEPLGIFCPKAKECGCTTVVTKWDPVDGQLGSCSHCFTKVESACPVSGFQLTWNDSGEYYTEDELAAAHVGRKRMWRSSAHGSVTRVAIDGTQTVLPIDQALGQSVPPPRQPTPSKSPSARQTPPPVEPEQNEDIDMDKNDDNDKQQKWEDPLANDPTLPDPGTDTTAEKEHEVNPDSAVVPGPSTGAEQSGSKPGSGGADSGDKNSDNQDDNEKAGSNPGKKRKAEDDVADKTSNKVTKLSNDPAPSSKPPTLSEQEPSTTEPNQSVQPAGKNQPDKVETDEHMGTEDAELRAQIEAAHRQQQQAQTMARAQALFGKNRRSSVHSQRTHTSPTSTTGKDEQEDSTKGPGRSIAELQSLLKKPTPSTSAASPENKTSPLPLASVHSAIEADVGQVFDDRRAHSSAFERSIGTAINSLQAWMMDFKNDELQHESEANLRQSRIKDNLDKSKEFEEANVSLRSELQQKTSLVRNMQDQIKRLDHELEAEKAEKERAIREKEDSRQDIESYKQLADENRNGLDLAVAESNDLRVKLEAANAENVELQRIGQEVFDLYEQRGRDLVAQTSRIEELESQVLDAQSRADALEVDLDIQKQAASQSSSENSNLHQRISELQRSFGQQDSAGSVAFGGVPITPNVSQARSSSIAGTSADLAAATGASSSAIRPPVRPGSAPPQQSAGLMQTPFNRLLPPPPLPPPTGTVSPLAVFATPGNPFHVQPSTSASQNDSQSALGLSNLSQQVSEGVSSSTAEQASANQDTSAAGQ